MKAITVRQPWAWAIAAGEKLVENRSRGTTYRGPLAIHAGKAWSTRGANDSRVVLPWATAFGHRLVDVDRVDPDGLERGHVIAVAQLVDSHPDAECCRPWGESTYAEGSGRVVTTVHHLVLEDVVSLIWPVEVPGALGLWTVPPHLVDELNAQTAK